MTKSMTTTAPTIAPTIGPIGIRAEGEDEAVLGGLITSVTTVPLTSVVVTKRIEVDVGLWDPILSGDKPLEKSMS